MPIQYNFNGSLGIIEVIALGEITVLDRAQFVHTAIEDKSMPVVAPILIDVSRITLAPTSDDLPRMAFLAETLASRFKSRIAYFVVTPGFVTLYLLAALTVRESLAEVRTFTDQATAINWLSGVPLRV